jgi:hypothetical protein
MAERTSAMSEPFRTTAAGSQTWIYGIGEFAFPPYQQFISTCYQVHNQPARTTEADFGRSGGNANFQTISVIHPAIIRRIHTEISKNLSLSIFFGYFH